tara:strand:+ start:24177 stop:25067 length:891 start_codon:yes stop_codon:yes gene_type:complete
MSQSTYVTIGIPFYNAEKYLEGAICSVLAQTHRSWELILIDDGSTDESLEIAKSYEQKDSRIRVLSDGENKKLASRLNQIIREAKYEFIARMDGDDLIPNDRIEKQLNFLLEHPEYDLVSSSLISISNNNELIGLRTYPHKNLTKSDVLLCKSNIVHASIIAKSSWYRRNIYNEATVVAQDYELWLNAIIKDDLNIGFIADYLYYYREEGNVKKNKMLRAYNIQIEAIKINYKGILTKKDCIKSIVKLQVKKAVVRSFSSLGLMSVIRKNRNKETTPEKVITEYQRQLKLIYEMCK